MKRVKVSLDNEIIEKMENYIKFYNEWSEIHDRQETYRTVEDLVRGAIMDWMDKVELFHPYSTGLKEKGKLKNNIKKYLKEKNIKQIDLAEEINIDRANLNMIINNRNQPTLDVFLRIWSVLGYPPLEEILYREKPN